MRNKIVLYYVLNNNGDSHSYIFDNIGLEINSVYDEMLEKLKRAYTNKTEFQLNNDNYSFLCIDMNKIVSFQLRIE